MKKLTIQQQLRLIEGLTLIYEDGPGEHEDAERIIQDIYKIAHLNGSCQNEHLDWHEEGNKLIKEFRELKICDCDRIK